MEIGRIAHAGLVVEGSGYRFIVDPFLTDEFEVFRLAPAIRLNRSALANIRWDGLVLTHAHVDHFSLESLVLFERNIPVFIPFGDSIMEHCLRTLGFKSIRGVHPFETFAIGAIRCTATRSLAPFPEMGVLFKSEGMTCWNMADSVVDEDVVRATRNISPRIDVLLTPYQPILETELISGTFSGRFPTERYRRLVDIAASVKARVVVPTACGLKSKTPWINDRLFPVTEEQFISDVRRGRPSIKALKMAPGDILRVSKGNGAYELRRQSLSFVRQKGRPKAPEYNWNPTREVPKLLDYNPSRYQPGDLRKRLRSYFDRDFLEKLRRPAFAEFRRELRRKEILWELEVIYPDGLRETRALDFTKRKLAWRAIDNSDFPGIRTAVPASLVLDVVAGEISPVSATHLCLVRTAFRSIVKTAAPEEDPLTAVLYHWADERNFLRRVACLTTNGRAHRPPLWHVTK